MRSRMENHEIKRRTPSGTSLMAALLLSSSGAVAAGATGSVAGSVESFLKRPLIVYVDGSEPAGASATAVMNQIHNSYQPHILPVLAGTKVEFRTGDPELHNVYGLAQKGGFTLFNWAMPPGSAPKTQLFNRPGIFKLSCSVHKEMEAYVVVLDNPHFVLVPKGENGFRIDKIPAGKKLLKVWFEKMDPAVAQKTFAVDVRPDAVTQLNLEAE